MRDARIQLTSDLRRTVAIQVERGTDHRLTGRIQLYVTYYHKVAVDVKLQPFECFALLVKALRIHFGSEIDRDVDCPFRHHHLLAVLRHRAGRFETPSGK